ncbi:hypothetical protein Ahy_A02g005930 [Arachis hypogaea]|uniref:Uncharacterized protein n=1 Tax=Arachis hypogaea TaxID=3818 RepID=A0A445E845_ARAHY|nr:hypothetical protein Ahy_A02g005930 [Arachis hypogaea]
MGFFMSWNGSATNKNGDSSSVKADRGNAAALAKALYWTYPRDREQAGMIAQMESELQPLESIDLDDNDEQVLLPR